jgi:two-component system chemotaxis sensor kinase CheA
MDDFEREIKFSFIEEALQMLHDVEEAYLQLEVNPSDSRIIDQIFRVAHNIKGSAKAVGFENVGAFSHKFENLLLKIKINEVNSSSELVSLLLKCNDYLKHMISSLKENFDAQFDFSDLVEQIKEAEAGHYASTTTTDTAISDTTTFETASAADIPSDIPSDISQMRNTKKSTAAVDESIRVSLSRLEQLTNFVGEIIVLQAVLVEQTQTASSATRKTIMELNKVLRITPVLLTRP